MATSSASLSLLCPSSATINPFKPHPFSGHFFSSYYHHHTDNKEEGEEEFFTTTTPHYLSLLMPYDEHVIQWLPLRVIKVVVVP